MQAEGRHVLQGKKPRFANCRQAYVMLYKESGILGFWRGEISRAETISIVQYLSASEGTLVKLLFPVAFCGGSR